jgi:hypothetical protein
MVNQLPEKWCIQLKNRDDWRNVFSKYSEFKCYSGDSLDAYYSPYNCSRNLLEKGYIEISMEQFKQFVLKEQIELEIILW